MDTRQAGSFEAERWGLSIIGTYETSRRGVGGCIKEPLVGSAWTDAHKGIVGVAGIESIESSIYDRDSRAYFVYHWHTTN